MSNSPQPSEQTVVKHTALIDWRKLLVPSLFIMVLPTLAALWVDQWLGTLPYITIVAIVICFPAATVLVIRIALQEMDRVIAEVAPPAQDEVQDDTVIDEVAANEAVISESAQEVAPEVVHVGELLAEAEQRVKSLPRHPNLSES